MNRKWGSDLLLATPCPWDVGTRGQNLGMGRVGTQNFNIPPPGLGYLEPLSELLRALVSPFLKSCLVPRSLGTLASGKGLGEPACDQQGAKIRERKKTLLGKVLGLKQL